MSEEREAVVWTATEDGTRCRLEFEEGRNFSFGVKFNQTTEHYHRDDGIGHFDMYHDGEWELWRKAWQAARQSAGATGQTAVEPVPVGWKIVPVEPTTEMLKAAQWHDGIATAQGVWTDMVRAAPIGDNGASQPNESKTVELTRAQREALERAVADTAARGHIWASRSISELLARAQAKGE